MTKTGWIPTYTGKQVTPFRPMADTIDLIDIAHSLSLTCRFTGHCKEFYSVAEHSVRLSQLVPEPLKPAALMHDASEAYMSDLSRPIKVQMPDYIEYEDTLLRLIFAKFNILQHFLHEIKMWDNRMLATEAPQLLTHPHLHDWEALPPPFELEIPISPWTPSLAESLFTIEAAELGLFHYNE